MEETKRINDLTTFIAIVKEMVAKSEQSWNESLGYSFQSQRIREYTKEEVDQIINSSSLRQQQELSRNFFLKDGFYKRIITYYATLLKYIGILIPNPSAGNELSTPYIQKRYNNALDYLDKINLPELLTRISMKVLIDGCYYGVLQNVSISDFVIFDLLVVVESFGFSLIIIFLFISVLFFDESTIV